MNDKIEDSNESNSLKGKKTHQRAIFEDDLKEINHFLNGMKRYLYDICENESKEYPVQGRSHKNLQPSFHYAVHVLLQSANTGDQITPKEAAHIFYTNEMMEA